MPRGRPADASAQERILRLLRQARRPLMIREIAEGIGVSRPTAAKYVDVCEAAHLVRTQWYATARQVSLVGKRSREEGP